MSEQSIPQRHSRTSAAAAALIATGIAMASAAPVTVHDATGRAVLIPDATRVVSIGGAVTETLYALGAQERIVGVDTTSLYPPQALQQKASVGYMRQLSPEGVLGLNPTLILAVEGAGPKETLEVLSAAGIPTVVVRDKHTGEGIIAKIRTIAEAIGAGERGACLADTVQADLDALTRVQAQMDRPKRVLFLLSFVNGRAMVAGRGTAADGIIRLAGAANAIGSYDGYKPINDEAVVAAKPDVILAMQRGGDALTAEAVFAHPAFSVTPAARARAFVAMDGLYLLGFGPRTARAARDLALALNPMLRRAALPSEQSGSSDCSP